MLIVGIGRGTKQLATYLDSTKTYETVVLFGVATTTYDIEGDATQSADAAHVTPDLVAAQLEQHFSGVIKQVPPIYSGLKVDGVKAVDYVRAGKELPRELAARDVDIHACELVEFMPAGSHDFQLPPQQQEQEQHQNRPAARIRVTVSSGFYVRSFAHDLGLACSTVATMASLHRSRQANFYAPPATPSHPSQTPYLHQPSSLCEDTLSSPGKQPPTPAIPLSAFADEHAWAPQVTSALRAWMALNAPRAAGERGPGRKKRDKEVRRQRFRGEWLAGTKRERVLQERKGREGQKGRVDG